MSEQQEPDPTVAAPEPAPELAPTKPEGDPHWLPERLDRARKSGQKELLDELGVKSASEIRELFEKQRAADEAAKSEEEKREQRLADLAKRADRADSYKASIEKHAETIKSTLTDEQREALEAVSADPQRQLDALPALQKTWASAPADPQPITTSPAPSAPADVNPGSPPDHKAVYGTLSDPESAEFNPFVAASYLQQHAPDILG